MYKFITIQHNKANDSRDDSPNQLRQPTGNIQYCLLAHSEWVEDNSTAAGAALKHVCEALSHTICTLDFLFSNYQATVCSLLYFLSHWYALYTISSQDLTQQTRLCMDLTPTLPYKYHVYRK